MKRGAMQKIAWVLSVCLFFSAFFGIDTKTLRAADRTTTITIDGRGDEWAHLVAEGKAKKLGVGTSGGWAGTTASALYLANDNTYLYYYVDAQMPDWGESGIMMNLALYVEGETGGIQSNPWGRQFVFQMENLPQLHILNEAKYQNDNYSTFYTTEDGQHQEGNESNQQGAATLDGGYEGKVRLRDLGLKNGDKLHPIVVLSGNNAGEHGAFNVIPAHPNNPLVEEWQISKPSELQVYAESYKVVITEEMPQLISPEVKDETVVFRYYSKNHDAIYVRGNSVGWDPGIKMVKDEKSNIFEVELSKSEFEEGINTYKFFGEKRDGTGEWLNDSNNPNTQGEDNIVYIDGLEVPNIYGILRGGTTVLPQQTVFFNERTQKKENVAISYSLKQPLEGVGIEENRVMLQGDYTQTTLELILSYGEYTKTISVKVVDELNDPSDYISPEVKNGYVTFRYYEPGIEQITVAGSFNGWDKTKDYLTQNEKGTWQITLPLPPGKHQYKFVIGENGWITDPKNQQPHVDGNSVVGVPGIIIRGNPEALIRGESTVLQNLGDFYTPEGILHENVNVTYEKIGDGQERIAVEEGKTKLILPQDESRETITLRAVVTLDDQVYDRILSFNVVSSLYSYTINYLRPKYDYEGWNLWLWADGVDGHGVAYSHTKDFILSNQQTYTFKQVTYQTTQPILNFITRKGEWEEKDWDDRRITIEEGEVSVEVWLIQEDPNVYYDINHINLELKAVQAFAESNHHIHLALSQDTDVLNGGYILLPDGSKVDVQTRKLRSRLFEMTLPKEVSIEPNKAYQVGAIGISAIEVAMRKVLDGYVYEGDDLGLTYTSSKSTFKVWAPTAVEVQLVLYGDEGSYDQETGRVVTHTDGVESAMIHDSQTGVWEVTKQGDLANQYYMYKVTFANGTTHYAVDPYARATSANGQRTAIIDLKQTNPKGFGEANKLPMISETDAIIYELHVRDFSVDTSVPFKYPGKFKAFTETGLQTPGGNKAGIDHLKALGVTHIHLLPVYDFASINELAVDDPNDKRPKFNWGYDPQNYNVPEGSYATDPTDPVVRIREFKEMVQALQTNGMRVVMDVVYNHTYSIEDGPFNKIVPNYYYRTHDNGMYANGSGCGNEIASERPMVRKYIKDSVNYWAREYQVDGFRFDLMGLIDTQTMEEITKEVKAEIDPELLIYGEPWQAGGSILPGNQQTLKGSQKGKGFAVFNDDIRGAIKGDSDGAGKGFATGATNQEQALITGLKGAVDTFAQDPTEVITYVTAHDNLNLWDKVIVTQGKAEQEGFLRIKDGELLDGGSVEEAVAQALTKVHQEIDLANVFANETVRRSLLANGIALTSQGIAFIHAGDEMLRSKYGDHNSYKSPDAINQIRWTLKDQFKPVYDYYEGLIALRKAHPAFRMTTAKDINEHFKVFKADDQVVGYTLGEYANGDQWKHIVVIYNGNTQTKQITLPHLADWKVVVNDEKAGTTPITTLTKTTTVEVAPLSMMVLYDEKRDYQSEPTTVTFTQAPVGMGIGDKNFIRVQVRDQEGMLLAVPVTLQSSHPEVIGVEGMQLVAKGEGQATITARAGKAYATIEVKVAKMLLPTTLTVTSDKEFLYEGLGGQLQAQIKDQFGQLMLNQKVSWACKTPAIARIESDGSVYGIKPGNAVFTATIGTLTERIVLNVRPYERRYIVLEYHRPDQDYEGWNLWVWNTGVEDGQILFTDTKDGKQVAAIEIGPETSRIGFIVRKSIPGNDWSEKDPDTDRFIDVEPGQIITKVQTKSGIENIHTLKPSGMPQIRPENATIFFTYRDNHLFKSGQMHTLEKVEVEINGTRYPMTYNEEEEWWSYNYKGLQEGTYLYSYWVTQNGVTTEVLDGFNLATHNGKSKLEYKKLNLKITATATPYKVDYNDNSVIEVQLEGDTKEVHRLFVDLHAVGGKEVEISKELMAVSIGIHEATQAGIKTLPIRVEDTMNNQYYAEVNLEVIPRVKQKDFDFDEAVIYFMLTDRFKNGDPNNDDPYGIGYNKKDPGTYQGGDFKGVTQKLDYLETLGINTIWISPIVENIAYDVRFDTEPYENAYYGYHGYWAKNFEKLNPHFGTVEDFHELIDEAHKRGIKIMVDIVINHAGYGMEGPMVNPPPHYPTDEERQIFEGMFRTNQSNDEVTGQLAGLPDFKTEDAAIRDKITQWQVAWVENLGRTPRGNTIDYFRVDTVKHVENETWMHLKNELTKVKPDFKMIGEAWGASVDNHLGYLNAGMMDALLDFSFKDIVRQFVAGDLEGAEQRLTQRNEKMTNTNTLGNFLSSHDEDGFLYRLDGDEERFKVAVSIQMTAKGQPVIYYGEELGYSGPNNYPKYDNRPTINWEQVDKEAGLLKHYQKLLQIRKRYPQIFAKGTRNQLAGSNQAGYMVIERRYKDQSIIVGLNLGEEKQITFDTPYKQGTQLTDLYHHRKYTVGKEGKLTIPLTSVADGGTVILRLADEDINDGNTNNGNTNTNVPPTTQEKEESKEVTTLSAKDLARLAKENRPVFIESGLVSLEIPTTLLNEDALKEIKSITFSLKRRVDEQVVDSAYRDLGSHYEIVIMIEPNEGNAYAYTSMHTPITIKITLEKDQLETIDDVRKVGAYFIDESGNKTFMGGKLEEDVLTFKTSHLSHYAVLVYEVTFEDVQKHWAQDAVEVLASRHIIKGMSPSHYMPNNLLTKAEFASLLTRALTIKPLKELEAYSDYQEELWYFEAVVALREQGALTNEVIGEFEAHQAITRQEVAYMIAKMYEKGLLEERLLKEDTGAFVDLEQVEADYKSSIEIVQQLDIIKGYPDGTVRANNHLTRAEAAQIIIALLYP